MLYIDELNEAQRFQFVENNGRNDGRYLADSSCCRSSWNCNLFQPWHVISLNG